MKPFFNIGDSIRYTGGYRDACAFVRTSPGIDGWVVARYSGSDRGRGGVIYASHKVTGEMAFYAGDFELAGPVVPEEYEAWFV